MIYALTANERIKLSVDFTLDTMDKKDEKGPLPNFEQWFFSKFSRNGAHLFVKVRYDDDSNVEFMHVWGDEPDVVAFKLVHLCD